MQMKHVLGYKCTICGAEYALGEIDYVCPQHGNDGIVDVVYDYGLLRSQYAAGQFELDHSENILYTNFGVAFKKAKTNADIIDAEIVVITRRRHGN